MAVLCLCLEGPVAETNEDVSGNSKPSCFAFVLISLVMLDFFLWLPEVLLLGNSILMALYRVRVEMSLENLVSL